MNPPTKAATAEDWKTLPLPARREPLNFVALYSDSDGERMLLGLIPESMDDKWFIYAQGGWLYFHLSWSGACIYALRLDGSPFGVRVIESWVNRDPAQYRCTDAEYDRQFLGCLIATLMLDQPAEFPSRGLEGEELAILQHSTLGRLVPSPRRIAASGPRAELLLPPLLERLLAAGRWPRDERESLSQNLETWIPGDRVQALAADERTIFLFPPPFRTVQELRRHNPFWTSRHADPEGIDPELVLDIGDFGLGSDSPMLLDYREALENRRVLRLKWSEDGEANRWVVLAPDFESFAETLGLTAQGKVSGG